MVEVNVLVIHKNSLECRDLVFAQWLGRMINKVNSVCLSHVKFFYHMKNEIDYFKHFEQCNIGNTDPPTNKIVKPKT